MVSKGSKILGLDYCKQVKGKKDWGSILSSNSEEERIQETRYNESKRKTGKIKQEERRNDREVSEERSGVDGK